MKPEEDLTQDEIDEKYREALRHTCSLCIMEGRCVCGELDPIEDEEEDRFFEENEEWGDDGFFNEEE